MPEIGIDLFWGNMRIFAVQIGCGNIKMLAQIAARNSISRRREPYAMFRLAKSSLMIGVGALFVAGVSSADDPASLEPVSLATVVEPSANTPDEPLAGDFSLERSKHFLDSAALAWQKNRNCMACHTNYLYLLSRPALGVDDEAHRTVRQYAEEMVTKQWKEKGPRWDAEVVMTALVLAFNDGITTTAVGTWHR